MEDAASRRDRLRRLREEAAGGGDGEDAAAAAAPPPDTSAPVLKFRNYAPNDKSLPADLAPAGVPEPVTAPPVDNPVAAAGDDADALLAAVAPKDPAADLKRNIAANLDKLERRTQRAMAEMLAEGQAGEGA